MKRKYGEGQRKRRPGIQRKEKKMEEKGLERLNRKQAGRRGNRSKGGKYEKTGETGVSIKVLHCLKKKKTLPSATIGLTFL